MKDNVGPSSVIVNMGLTFINYKEGPPFVTLNMGPTFRNYNVDPHLEIKPWDSSLGIRTWGLTFRNFDVHGVRL